MGFQKLNKNKWFLKYINQLSQQLNNSGWRGAILQFCISTLSFDQEAGRTFVIDIMQGWWRWLVRKTHTAEKVSVSGVTVVSWNNVYVLDIFSLQQLDQKKSRFSFSHIPAWSLLNKQRSEDRTVQVFLWVEGACSFLTSFSSVTTVAYLFCCKTEGTTLSKDKLISSIWCHICKYFSSEFHAVTLILSAPDKLVFHSWKCSYETRKVC